MIEKIKSFYEMEFKRLGLALDKHYAWTTPQEMKNNALQRMLGIAYFVQYSSDLDYRDIEALYGEYKNKIEAL